MIVREICCLLTFQLFLSKVLIAQKKAKRVGQSAERVDKTTTGATLQTIGITVHHMVSKVTFFNFAQPLRLKCFTVLFSFLHRSKAVPLLKEIQ